MLLPFPTDPSLPSNVAPLFGDISAVRGDHMRANNSEIWANFAAVNLMIPVGTVLPLIQSYFGVNNSAPVHVAVDLPEIWKESDGSALNDTDSPIWNAAGRYLPNLTGDIFLMGSTSAGGVGGDNDATHNHGAGELVGDSHNHNWYYFNGTSANDKSYDIDGRAITIAPGSHYYSGIMAQVSTAYKLNQKLYTDNKSVSISGNSADNTAGTENRPNYMACKYIIRIK